MRTMVTFPLRSTVGRIAGFWIISTLGVTGALTAQSTPDVDGTVVLLHQHCGSSPEAMARMGGTIRDLLTTAPAPELRVSLHSLGESAARETTITDREGRFYFCNAGTQGQALLRVHLPQHHAAAVEFAVHLTSPSTWVGSQYLEVGSPARLMGRVTRGSAGEPVANAEIRARRPGVSTRTDADGRFELHGVAGEIALEVRDPRAGSHPARLWLDGGFHYDLDVRLPTDRASDATLELRRGPEVVALRSPAKPPRIPESAPPTAVGSVALRLDAPAWQERSVVEGDPIRVRARGIATTEGTLTALSAEALTVENDRHQWTVPLEDLESVEVRSTDSVRQMLWVGLVGAGLGAAAGRFMEVDAGCITEQRPGGTLTTCYTEPYGMGKGALIGTAAGVGLGFALGRVVLRWTPIF